MITDICLVNALDVKSRNVTDYQAMGLNQNAVRNAVILVTGYKCYIRPDLGVFVFISVSQ